MAETSSTSGCAGQQASGADAAHAATAAEATGAGAQATGAHAATGAKATGAETTAAEATGAGAQATGAQARAGERAAGHEARREALLVDWGGVLTTNLFVSFHAYCDGAGIDFEDLGRRFLGDRDFRDLLVALETGKLAEDAFEPRLAALLGVAPDGLIDGLLAGVGPDEAMIAAVRDAHDAGVRTALVSNSWGVHRYPHALFAEIFDGVVISGEVGVRKPAPRMYELGAERAGVAPARCVYVDDLRHNLEPARALGMAAIHHTTAASTIPELERLLGISLSGGDRRAA